MTEYLFGLPIVESDDLPDMSEIKLGPKMKTYSVSFTTLRQGGLVATSTIENLIFDDYEGVLRFVLPKLADDEKLINISIHLEDETEYIPHEHVGEDNNEPD
jgi:hypothetical protein